jgi:Kef-type K+ transport system membrane component KefB
MNEIGSLGLILLLALAAGHLVKALRVPEVTGYLIAGVVLGPSVLGWVSTDNLGALEAFSEVALGLILFSLGTVFEFDHFRKLGRQLAVVVLVESAFAALAVAGGSLIAGRSWPVALILGVIAIETAAASTLMVLRECNAQGPLTDLLTAVFALDNVLCLVAFNLAVAAIQFATGAAPALEAFGPTLWQFVGSAALGYIAGFLLAMWSKRVVEHGEQLILVIGCVLLCVGASRALAVSPMVTNLAVGATFANLSGRSRAFLDSLGHTDPPHNAIFFVLAGAELNLSLLGSLGVTGAIYVFGRLAGKFAGAKLGAKLAGSTAHIRRALPTAMFAQAGLAVGLTLVIERRLPQFAPELTTVILSSVIIFELIGPFGVRWTLIRAGESHADEPNAAGSPAAPHPSGETIL